MKNLYACFIVAGIMSAAAQAVEITPQPWQLRRAEYAKTLQGVARHDPGSLKTFDDILTEFDAGKMNRTPLENMEILGTYYVPREGAEKNLPVIVMMAMLGWYDTLRFASESGKAEISRSLFKMPLALAGPAATAQAVKLFNENPAQTERLVAQGICFAAKLRHKVNYDQQWPTAFGLEHVICAQGGACDKIPPLPESEWDAAWAEAGKRVRAYYRGNADNQLIK